MIFVFEPYILRATDAPPVLANGVGDEGDEADGGQGQAAEDRRQRPAGVPQRSRLCCTVG